MITVFPYNHLEPKVLTDLKNKLFENFYIFLTLPYNYLSTEFLAEYNTDDIRNPLPRRPANEIVFNQAYTLAKSMVDDIREAFNHFNVGTVPNGTISYPAVDPLQWGPSGVN